MHFPRRVINFYTLICLHVTSPSPCLSKFNIVPIVSLTLMGKIAYAPILFVKVSVKKDKKIRCQNGDVVSTCKRSVKKYVTAQWRDRKGGVTLKIVLYKMYAVQQLSHQNDI